MGTHRVHKYLYDDDRFYPAHHTRTETRGTCGGIGGFQAYAYEVMRSYSYKQRRGWTC